MPQILDIEFDFDFLLLGISCHEKDYRLAWYLNKELGFDFHQTEEFVLPKKEGVSRHAIFEYSVPEDHIMYTLIGNRGEGGVLLPEFPQVDYLIKWDESMDCDQAELIRMIRNLPIVQGVFMIPFEGLKSRENLLF